MPYLSSCWVVGCGLSCYIFELVQILQPSFRQYVCPCILLLSSRLCRLGQPAFGEVESEPWSGVLEVRHVQPPVKSFCLCTGGQVPLPITLVYMPCGGTWPGEQAGRSRAAGVKPQPNFQNNPWSRAREPATCRERGWQAAHSKHIHRQCHSADTGASWQVLLFQVSGW